MDQYQYALRNELASYSAELMRWESPDLAKMLILSKDLLDRYLAQPEASWEARQHFYQTLYEINNRYYELHVNASRSNKTKFFNLFGGRAHEEKEFLKWQDHLKSRAKTARNTWHANWQEDFLLSVVTDQLHIAKGDPKHYLHGVDPSANHRMRLCLYSHRLMREKAFLGDEYAHFHGLPFELSAYKLKREIEKFINQYSAGLSRSQKKNLVDCVQAITGFLKIQERLVFSRHLSVNNTLEKGVKHNQTYEHRYDDICFRVHHQLHHLQPRERLLIPHGYHVQNKTGHAALVEFERQPDGRFKISFINTGSGVDVQNRGIWSDFKFKYLGILNITYVENVSFESILAKKLITMIFEPVVHPLAMLYSAVAAMNAAMGCFANELKETNHAINIQKNGTCAFSCWIEWLGWHLDPGVFSALDLFMNERALQKLQRFSQDNTVPPELKKGIAELYEAGAALVANNRNDLSIWLAENSANDNWQAISAIAKSRGIVPKPRISPEDEVMKSLDEFFNVKETEKKDEGAASLGLFGTVAAGVAIVAAAATIYSRLT